jgi:hypothetical protein
LRSFRSSRSTQANLPLFLGVVLGVLVVLGIHLAIGPHDSVITIVWQMGLAALIGSFLGALVRRG